MVAPVPDITGLDQHGSYDNFEHLIGREVMRGRLRIEDAVKALGNFIVHHTPEPVEPEFWCD